MCLYENEKASGAGFSQGASLTRLCWSRETPLRSLSWTAGAPVGCPGFGSRAQGPRWSSWRHCTHDPPTSLRVSVSPTPDTVFSKTQETHGTWHLWVYSRGSINAAQTPGRKEPGPPVLTRPLNDLMHGLKQDGSPPGPRCPPLSCQETHWVAALPAQGFVTLEVTS